MAQGRHNITRSQPSDWEHPRSPGRPARSLSKLSPYSLQLHLNTSLHYISRLSRVASLCSPIHLDCAPLTAIQSYVSAPSASIITTITVITTSSNTKNDSSRRVTLTPPRQPYRQICHRLPSLASRPCSRPHTVSRAAFNTTDHRRSWPSASACFLSNYSPESFVASGPLVFFSSLRQVLRCLPINAVNNGC